MTEMIPVESSNIVAIGWKFDELEDGVSYGRLTIQFKGGSTYDYERYPENDWDEFREAESAGRFFHSRIRGQYEGQKRIPEDEDNG